MDDNAEKVVLMLKKRGFRIAFAESCTGGLATARLVGVAGSSAVLDASVVTYANKAKVQYLGVDEKIIDKFGVVSEPVAKAMAGGVRKFGNAQIGVGITGIAGPDGGSDEKPVGTVCFGFDLNGICISFRKQFGGLSRNEVREKSVDFVFDKLNELLK